MKIATVVKTAAFIAAVSLSAAVMAYSPEMDEQECKKPKYREFSLPEYHSADHPEVPPESEFTFTLSAWADKDTIKLTAKKQPLPFTVETTSTFHRIHAKLPASLNGQFVRIDATVKAVLGCDEQAGWLVKVAEKK